MQVYPRADAGVLQAWKIRRHSALCLILPAAVSSFLQKPSEAALPRLN
jgi:hypothetical protein